jgi:hypothetical protein
MTHSERRNMWIERISTFKESGLSLPKWCAANDIKTYGRRQQSVLLIIYTKIQFNTVTICYLRISIFFSFLFEKISIMEQVGQVDIYEVFVKTELSNIKFVFLKERWLK